MSEGYIMGAGGDIFAAIAVIYPEGSALTCKDAEGTLELAANNTSGQWVFSIPCTGTWTVTATDGTNTKSQSVEITAEGQFESLALAYEYVIFDQENGLAAGVDVGGKAEVITDDVETYLFFAHGGGYNNMSYIDTGLDLTDYDTLEIYGYATANRYIAFWDVKPTSANVISGETPAASVTMAKGTEPEMYTLDVSSLAGVYYLATQYATGNTYVFSLILR